ncbi:hypothetical protein [Anaeromyxobacter oryzae]|uniref:Uncharacterized protein n=1 Tax=Anaeromyxobacter oryzae TaxID=2918170 RepID=A0ABM7WSY4_9BACT|nr:hypothetical protein [Anaeromyxobacter oryzae]BDG02577.1 hypothetical protein AMOR_15730 [Anaeromyxobacter oryzae]
MERSARLLLATSLAGFAAVVGFGTIRASPAHHLLDTPEAVKSFQAFHAHFDALVWLGAAALGAALKVLAASYRGPAWAPRVLAPAYALGAVVFSVSYAVKAVGERFGMRVLARPIAPALASAGGLALLAAAGCAAVIAWGVARPAAAGARAGFALDSVDPPR